MKDRLEQYEKELEEGTGKQRQLSQELTEVMEESQAARRKLEADLQAAREASRQSKKASPGGLTSEDVIIYLVDKQGYDRSTSVPPPAFGPPCQTQCRLGGLVTGCRPQGWGRVGMTGTSPRPSTFAAMHTAPLCLNPPPPPPR